MKSVCLFARLSVCPFKIKDYILCILSALLLILSFPKFNLWSLAWIGFIPLFFVLQNKSKLKVFLVSYLVGFIFWLGIIYWLAHVTFVGMILIVAYLALYFGVFSLIINHYSLLSTSHSMIFVPCVWVILEYLRSHLFTGFGWALIGYSQYLNLPIIQIANLTGGWGVSFLVIMINVFIYRIMDYGLRIKDKKQKKTYHLIFATYFLPILLLFLSLGYGFYKIDRASSIEYRASIKASVVQANIAQSIKWQEYAKGQIWQQYSSLNRMVLKDRPELIIWPEAALPGILEKDPHLKNNLKAFVRDMQIPLLLGAVSLDRDNYYNSAILIPRQDKFTPLEKTTEGAGENSLTGLIQRYDKIHLVPFGEYIPLERIFSFLETIVPIGDFTSGAEYTVFSLDTQTIDSLSRNPISRSVRLTGKDQVLNGQVRFSVLICFEDIFPEIARQFVKGGADFLVNITNDAWFSDTSSPYQHLSASVFRAIENDVYLVRAANTGISGFITPEGRVYPLIDPNSGKQTFISGYKTKDVFLKFDQDSLYTQWGDWFILFCGVIVLCGMVRFKFAMYLSTAKRHFAARGMGSKGGRRCPS